MMSTSILLGAVLVISSAAKQFSPECEMCMDIAKRAKATGSDNENATKTKALQGAVAYSGDEKQQYTDELNCHWPKYFNDANFNPSATPLSTCADTGFCPLSYQNWSFPIVDITNITTSYYTTCVMPVSLLIHHTVTNTSQATIDSLINQGLSVQYIVDKNGTIFQMVNDWHGAWHAGAGQWKNWTLLNHKSIGIENVNDGTSPFTTEQIAALTRLVDTLRKRWFIDETNIIGHSDYAPDRKQDPSGYFPWQEIYNSLNMFLGLFPSTLSNEEQHRVLISNSTQNVSVINGVQDGLTRYGYTRLVMTPDTYDFNMSYNIQAFNRHFCPEVFIKEKEDYQTLSMILNDKNQQWYGESDEKLKKLLHFVKE